MVRPVIVSIKHMVQAQIASVTQGALANVALVNAVDTADSSIPTQITQGSIVKAIYIELWIIGAQGTEGSFTITVDKISSGAPDMSAANGFDLHNYPNKKNILYTTQGVLGDQNTNPVPILRQWIAIPKGKQRFGLSDKLNLNILSNLGTVEFCGQFVYKEYK